MIDTIKVSGAYVVEPVEVMQAIFDHFKKNFSKQWSSRPSIRGYFRKIDHKQAVECLKDEFSEEEVFMMGDIMNFMKEFIVMAGWGLNLLLSRAKEKGIFTGVNVGANGLNVSHLQYADDTVIFCETEWSEIIAIKRILRCFEVVYGLRLNFYKSVMCGIGVDKELVSDFATVLNCCSQKLPLKYLGLPLGANPHTRLCWKPIIDNFKRNLTGWKRKMLSFIGKFVLIKSILSSLLVYYMCLFKLPECVAKELDRLQASFLWGDSEVKRKIHLVKWREIIMNLKQGDVGIRDIRLANQSLLVKWWWRFALEDDSL
ncbi:uncharacterized protein LOC114282838 [Camellia sinensis]|uniref:uncharacterized protein LOC114282838 n=1 Tax=Camellia sinensis TaxID=4442 RepID=UPI001036AF73|nr:uncharacterized protein LOC114282838 [Camellia sinensis]